MASVETSALFEAERVATALARLDIHDVEVRGSISKWLLRPLAPARFASLAMDLARVGLCDAVDPKVARHVRARARSSEFVGTLGDVVTAKLLCAYSQTGPLG